MQQRDDSGILFKNDRKDSEKKPDWRGEALVDGIEYWMAMWVKPGKNGKFLSVSFTAKDQNYSKPKQTQQTQQESFDEDLPF